MSGTRASEDSGAGRRFVDLGLTIDSGMVTHLSLQAAVISDYPTREDSRALYQDGLAFSMKRIGTLRKTGACLDSRFHRHADGVRQLSRKWVWPLDGGQHARRLTPPSC
jgi:kynurenine formamidase